jgi:hypothetical protein
MAAHNGEVLPLSARDLLLETRLRWSVHGCKYEARISWSMRDVGSADRTPIIVTDVQSLGIGSKMLDALFVLLQQCQCTGVKSQCPGYEYVESRNGRGALGKCASLRYRFPHPRTHRVCTRLTSKSRTDIYLARLFLRMPRT